MNGESQTNHPMICTRGSSAGQARVKHGSKRHGGALAVTLVPPAILSRSEPPCSGVAREHSILLMLCAPRDTLAGGRVGCFPNLYGALAGDPPDQIITL
jgi:hypothetical protein